MAMDDIARLGSRLAASFAGSSSSGSALHASWATVKATGTSTLDLTFAAGDVLGVICTTACSGAEVGDRALVLVDGPRLVAIGIVKS